MLRGNVNKLFCKYFTYENDYDIKIVTSFEEKAQCVLWFHVTRSATTVQYNFRKKYQQTPPDAKSIKRWYDKFKNTESIEDFKRTGKPKTNDDSVDAVCTAFQ